jgi:hypothetical protein
MTILKIHKFCEVNKNKILNSNLAIAVNLFFTSPFLNASKGLMLTRSLSDMVPIFSSV